MLQGIKRLYSTKDIDRKKELRKLNHSILVNFLDLIDILIKCPESPRREEKVEDINLLFIHMHHLVNEFRPHQARETLRVMLEVQKRHRLETIERLQKHLDKVSELVTTCVQQLPDTDLDNKLLVNTEALSIDAGHSASDEETCALDDTDLLITGLADDLT